MIYQRFWFVFVGLCSVFVLRNAEIWYNRTTVLLVCVVCLYVKMLKFGTIALHP
ncbi:hypothetical protein HMPREF1583_01023 [Gardnerella vaginalis JCP8151B]|nr:hypothetical protein HMPREF1583_01023 [Gardnerella vaginalis JCP8151B]EPI46232.1 hypothetical protein HMPREF1582_01161 [Gardnerella vaginalis JCP8151A]